MGNRDAIASLKKYLSSCSMDYVIFGGLATSLVLMARGISFRETHDADIMLVSRVSDDGFGQALSSLINEGGYKNAYVNEKKTAYRFVSPSNMFCPKVIELFA